MNTTYIKKSKPSCIPIPKDTKSIKNSHFSTSTDLQKPSSPTPPNSQTTMKQSTPPTPRTSTASTHPQHTRKTPLLPTQPAQSRQSTFPRPSPFITRPSPIYNKFHQQPYTPRPFNHQSLPTDTRTPRTTSMLHTSSTTLPESTHHPATILHYIGQRRKKNKGEI